MIRKLRTKFVCITMSFVTVMLLVIFAMVIFFMGLSLEMRSVQGMQDFFPGGPGDFRPEERWSPYFVAQVDGSGNVAVSSRGWLEESDQAWMEDVIRRAMGREEPQGVFLEEGVRYRRTGYPGGQLILFADISQELQTMRQLILSCGLIGCGSFLVFLLISIWLARWAVGPVEQAWQQQKQFVADASHELKTPLTVILTGAELLQDGHQDPQLRQQSVESILTMSRQMRGLVEALLELARVDNGAVATSFADTDLSGLAEMGVMTFEPVFYEKGLGLVSSIEPGLWVRGSESHLAQVLSILLDNAVKYSTPGGETRVTLRRQGNHLLLTVANPGPAISREDLENIFKRFYRVDKARSRDGSYGLGLSIARRILEEHRGRLWAKSEGGINTFCAQLPGGN